MLYGINSGVDSNVVLAIQQSYSISKHQWVPLDDTLSGQWSLLAVNSIDVGVSC